MKTSLANSALRAFGRTFSKLRVPNPVVIHKTKSQNINQKTNRLTLSALARFTGSAFTAVLLPAVLWLSPLQTSRAGSATWATNPGNGDWNNPANWTPMTVPNSSTDTATFGSSNTTSVSTSDAVAVDAIVFNPGASAYTIVDSALPFPSDELFIEGAGITNNSGVTQNFVIAGDEGSNSEGFMTFNNNASAGNLTVFTNEGAIVGNGSGGILVFGGTSTATNSTFVTKL